MPKKPKTVTVNVLYRMLAKLISDGRGRLPVCVSKGTFKDNREGDGCTILPVVECAVERICLADDDGDVALTKAGLEKTRLTAVLSGGAGVYSVPETKGTP